MGTPLRWITFNFFILLALALDLGVFHRKVHKVRLKEAAFWSALWITLATVFGIGIWQWFGGQRGLEYFTGYIIEKALSVDNLFVFLVIFRVYHVDERVQHRVLAWGIVGALIMRGMMIAAGAELISKFQWVLLIFGAFLVYTGMHMLWVKEKDVRYEKNPLFRYASRHLRVTESYHAERFIIRENGRRFVTPLFLVLLVVEITDATFAIDSIPAIFGITRDAFIVYTSNVFAILGLRALYFLLADLLEYFRYLGIGLAAVLIFIGGKMISDPWVHIPVGISLSIVGGVILIALLASFLTPAKKKGSPIERLSSASPSARNEAAAEIYRLGRAPADSAAAAWRADREFSLLLLGSDPLVTVGLAVQRETFARIRSANGTPKLAEVPPDQDAEEFELHFPQGVLLDILTTRQPGGSGAIARYLAKFGEGVQQVEFRCTNVDRATQILKENFGIVPVYPATRPGADGTRVNFFLVPSPGTGKVLIELYESPAAIQA
jgi:TerC family integral membrane protein